MSRISRRHFLQFAGSTLATLGLSQWEIINQGNRYAKVLAQDTPRKLALLVGINQYPNSDRFGNLAGCVTDVDLQQYLLIHRFGFNPDDIVCLTTDDSPDRQPTRDRILTVFEEHLIWEMLWFSIFPGMVPDCTTQIPSQIAPIPSSAMNLIAR